MYTVRYTDMACGELLAARVPTLESCAMIAKRHGNHFFSYNQWWKFCLACDASELETCDEPVVDVIGCHYQVRARAHTHMGRRPALAAEVRSVSVRARRRSALPSTSRRLEALPQTSLSSG